MRALVLATAPLAILGASATAQPAAHPLGADAGGPPRECFFSREISSWSEVDDTTATVRVGVSRNYRLDLLSPCPELRQTMSLGLVSHRGGDSICTGDSFDLLVRDVSGQGTRRCNVQSMQPISREDAAALGRRHRR